MSDPPRPPADRGGLVPQAAPSPLSRRQRDFLLLNIYVQIRHGYHDRALVLAETLRRLGDGSVEALLAHAVLLFLEERWGEALATLDELDRLFPLERFGTYRLSERQRMRRYLRSRCLFELGEPARARDALEGYLRHGGESADEEVDREER